MARPDAAALASRQWHILTQCGVTVKALQALKTQMYDHPGMDLGMARLRTAILPLATQHVTADKVGQLYTALSSGYTMSGGLGLPKADAQDWALKMAPLRAEPDQLYELYKVMYGYFGIGFDQKTAQQTTIQLALAGADAAVFQDTYTQTKNQSASSQMATDKAIAASTIANLQGLVRRYAKDAHAYTASEFQQHYAAGWLVEWLDAPMEMRISDDRLAHTASQFKRHFGKAWATKYRTGVEAIQMRLANDATTYTMQEYQKYYGDDWQRQWAASPELPCAQCAPFKERAAQLVV